jgi:protein-S-isoprenylcysteine O-methyltransferase Ste14
MNRFKKWAEHKYSKNQRIFAVIFGGIVFWVAIPLFILAGSFYMDTWFHLPRYRYGSINPWVGLLCMILGWLFANWTVRAQFSLGRGTPIPLMATQRLVATGPYAFCRNPMTLGTAAYYVGIAVWVGSLSAL